MKPLSALSAHVRRNVRGVFLDIDDTLTTGGTHEPHRPRQRSLSTQP